PWRRPELFSQNPVSDYEIAGIPVVSIVSAVYAVILLVIFWLWGTRPVYGLKNVQSGGFMVFLYLLAAGIYLVMRYKRRQEGVELSEIHAEIPKD
ncbi:MAG: hypothetical protein ABEH59_04345, partial [Halobacteriales archaeon]